VFIGNPHAEGREPGFIQPVLQLVYHKSISDGKWLIPDNVIVHESVMCSYESETNEITTMQSYQNVLSHDAKVGGGFIGIKFSASVGYKNVESEIADMDRVFISSVAKCSVYEAFFTEMASRRFRRNVETYPIRVTELFRDAVADLPNNASDPRYYQFLDTFGTHYASKIVLGSKAIWMNTLEKSQYTTLKSDKFNFGVGAGSFILESHCLCRLFL